MRILQINGTTLQGQRNCVIELSSIPCPMCQLKNWLHLAKDCSTLGGTYDQPQHKCHACSESSTLQQKHKDLNPKSTIHILLKPSVPTHWTKEYRTGESKQELQSSGCWHLRSSPYQQRPKIIILSHSIGTRKYQRYKKCLHICTIGFAYVGTDVFAY
jgi:hypothetical protein